MVHLLCPNGPQISLKWISKVKNRHRELTVLIYILCKGRYQIPSQTLQEDHLRPVQASLQPRPLSLPQAIWPTWPGGDALQPRTVQDVPQTFWNYLVISFKTQTSKNDVSNKLATFLMYISLSLQKILLEDFCLPNMFFTSALLIISVHNRCFYRGRLL